MNNYNLQFKKLIGIICVILFVVSVVLVINAIYIRQTTGLLEIKTQDKSAPISITSEKSTATNIATGTKKVRLKPGTYQLYSVSGNRNIAKTVSISAKKSTSVTLSFPSQPTVRSVDDVSFTGFDALINGGLTNDQVTNIEQLLFQFKPTAEEVVIDGNSIVSAPHERGSSIFTLNFAVVVDSINYSASATYSDLETVSLRIQSGDGLNTLLYDSAAAQSGSGQSSE